MKPDQYNRLQQLKINKKISAMSKAREKLMEYLRELQNKHEFSTHGWSSHHHVEWSIDRTKEQIEEYTEEIKYWKTKRH